MSSNCHRRQNRRTRVDHLNRHHRGVDDERLATGDASSVCCDQAVGRGQGSRQNLFGPNMSDFLELLRQTVACDLEFFVVGGDSFGRDGCGRVIVWSFDVCDGVR